MTFLMFRTTTGAASIEKPTKPPDDLAQTVRVCRNNLLPLPSRVGLCLFTPVHFAVGRPRRLTLNTELKTKY